MFKPFLTLRLNPQSDLGTSSPMLRYLYFPYHDLCQLKTPYACASSWVPPCLYVVVACVHVCGKGGTHCLLLCCHWAASPDQQPCRPDRRWARLLLQLILCSPSAAPDSAGRSPLEEGWWSGESKRVREGGKRGRKKTKGGGERGRHCWYLWWIYAVRRDGGEKRNLTSSHGSSFSITESYQLRYLESSHQNKPTDEQCCFQRLKMPRLWHWSCSVSLKTVSVVPATFACFFNINKLATA